MVNVEQIKDDILAVLRAKGPSLPVHIAAEIKSNTLFTSAFLSELVSEKKIKMSNMRVGSSPIYFLSGQEAKLEKFAEHLKSKEKEAFLLLKEKNFLIDSLQQPAIRVALREIKDFALPFKSQEGLVWRYFLTPESEFKKTEIIAKKEPIEETQKTEMLVEIPIKSTTKRKKSRRIGLQKEKFFSKIKEFLARRSIELKDIESFTNNEIILRVLDHNQEKILVAYNKRKITDNDIIKAYKKTAIFKLPYLIVGLNEPSKKSSELLKALKDLSSIHGLSSENYKNKIDNKL